MIKSIALGTAAAGALLYGLMPTGCAPAPAPANQTATVKKIVDGDTIRLTNGEYVRLIGEDTPERGECGFAEATARLAQIIRPGSTVALVPSGGARDDRDNYNRMLRYVEVPSIDLGLLMIQEGYATARYDGNDGYGAHDRQAAYDAADASSPNICGR